MTGSQTWWLAQRTPRGLVASFVEHSCTSQPAKPPNAKDLDVTPLQVHAELYSYASIHSGPWFIVAFLTRPMPLRSMLGCQPARQTAASECKSQIDPDRLNLTDDCRCLSFETVRDLSTAHPFVLIGLLAAPQKSTNSLRSSPCWQQVPQACTATAQMQ